MADPITDFDVWDARRQQDENRAAAAASNLTDSDFSDLALNLAHSFIKGKDNRLAVLIEFAIKCECHGGDYDMGDPDYPNGERLIKALRDELILGHIEQERAA